MQLNLFKAPLTPTERIVEEAIVSGKTNKEIAFERNRSLKTIHFQRMRIYEKRGVHTVVELIHALFHLQRKIF